ncbi:hypothetical protein M422DRAFT_96479, partial [Sphaerobolus stellatus SS14]
LGNTVGVIQRASLHTYLFFHQGYVADDIPDRIPLDVQEAALVFKPNTRFSLVNDKSWSFMVASKEGFLRLGPNGRPFATSFNHQLHCVNAVRFDYTVARDGLVTDEKELKAKLGHINHCFQFLRQSILCKADNTLVPLEKYNGSIVLNGFGGPPHRCRDWAQIRHFVENN